MFTLTTILFGIAAIVLSFFNVTASFATLAVPTIGFAILLFALKAKKYEYISTLSDGANELIRKYGHFYLRPRAGADCSGSCSFIVIASMTITIISCIRGEWWSIPGGIAIYAVAAYTARGFNPMNFLLPAERPFHDEIANVLNSEK